MNPVISAQLREFSKSHSIADVAPETRFELYSIFSILTGLLGENIDPHDVHLTGNEFGLDGIAILIQGEPVKNRLEAEDKLTTIKNPSVEFIFFQAKTSTNYDYGDISKFFDAIDDFFDGELNSESEQVADLNGAILAIYEIGVGKRNPKISCYYAATGNYEKPARIEKLKNAFLSQLGEKNIFDDGGIAVDIVGARDLQQWYRAATSAVEVEIEFPRNVVMPTNDNVEEAYIGYIDAINLIKLFSLKDSSDNIIGVNRSVFFDNIRDYDAKSKINIGIKDSVAQSGGGDFVFRNNGITVVSKSIDRTGDRFRLEDFQIVNGCQTSNVVFELLHGETEIDEQTRQKLFTELKVPFRLIGSKNDDFVSSIILGTNRQNPVRDEQFWALRPFMKSFEEYCRNLDAEDVIFFERRENQYRNVNVERTRIVQPSILMKSIAACLLFQPHRAARDYRGLLSEYESSIFLDEHDVRIYHSVAYLYYRLEFLWRNQRIESDYKTFRYYILFGIGLMITSGNNVFSMKKAKIAQCSEEIIALARDEEKFKLAVNNVVKTVQDRLSELGVSSQEKIRDTIRSEAFAHTVRERLVGGDSPGVAAPP